MNEEFAQKFVNAYNIPKLESRETTATNAAWRFEWRYVSPDGVSVHISQKTKAIQIFKTDAQREQGNLN